MKRARAELAAHLMKAARGADLPLAVAEDLYQAAYYVIPEDVVWIAEDIRAGGAGLMALTGSLDQIACGGSADAVVPVAQALAAARGWSLADGRKCDDPPECRAGPIEVPDALWADLDGFAVRTYVPESEASRARGAGAGQIDND